MPPPPPLDLPIFKKEYMGGWGGGQSLLTDMQSFLSKFGVPYFISLQQILIKLHTLLNLALLKNKKKFILYCTVYTV